mmetsp:Transcript_4404/g.9818  ORF Transcript_4404/g.9818 Transcript_4404/m.9818 type:complete len:209 (+) Transcript_4404:1244-1870(+)
MKSNSDRSWWNGCKIRTSGVIHGLQRLTKLSLPQHHHCNLLISKVRGPLFDLGLQFWIFLFLETNPESLLSWTVWTQTTRCQAPPKKRNFLLLWIVDAPRKRFVAGFNVNIRIALNGAGCLGTLIWICYLISFFVNLTCGTNPKRIVIQTRMIGTRMTKLLDQMAKLRVLLSGRSNSRHPLTNPASRLDPSLMFCGKSEDQRSFALPP